MLPLSRTSKIIDGILKEIKTSTKKSKFIVGGDFKKEYQDYKQVVGYDYKTNTFSTNQYDTYVPIERKDWEKLIKQKHNHYIIQETPFKQSDGNMNLSVEVKTTESSPFVLGRWNKNMKQGDVIYPVILQLDDMGKILKINMKI